MSANVENQSSGHKYKDLPKWIAIVIVLAGMASFNHLYGESSVLIRAVGFVVAVGLCLAIGSQTEKGRTFIAFAKESRIEVRRVIWPTRQEAYRMTMIVGVATLLTAFALWAIDAVLMAAVGFVTGLRF